MSFNEIFQLNTPHILFLIFSHLSFEDFKKCLHVSKLWRKVLLEHCQQDHRFQRLLGVKQWMSNRIISKRVDTNGETIALVTRTTNSEAKELFVIVVESLMKQGVWFIWTNLEGDIVHTSQVFNGNNVNAFCNDEYVMVTFPHQHKTLLCNMKTYEVTKLSASHFMRVLPLGSRFFAVNSVHEARRINFHLKVIPSTNAEKRESCILQGRHQCYPYCSNSNQSIGKDHFVTACTHGVVEVFELPVGKLKWTKDFGSHNSLSSVTEIIRATENYIVVRVRRPICKILPRSSSSVDLIHYLLTKTGEIRASFSLPEDSYPLLRQLDSQNENVAILAGIGEINVLKLSFPHVTKIKIKDPNPFAMLHERALFSIIQGYLKISIVGDSNEDSIGHFLSANSLSTNNSGNATLWMLDKSNSVVTFSNQGCLFIISPPFLIPRMSCFSKRKRKLEN